MALLITPSHQLLLPPPTTITGFMAQLLEHERRTTGQVTVELDKYEENRFGETAALVCAA